MDINARDINKSNPISKLDLIFTALDFVVSFLNLGSEKISSNQQIYSSVGTILSFYSAPHRHYHTLEHILELLELFHLYNKNDSTPKVSPTVRCIIYLVILYHDIIYEPKSKTNEIDSEKVFRNSPFNISSHQDISKRVSHIILATQHHLSPLDSTICDSLSDSTYSHLDTTSIFLDMDLGILGVSDIERYKDYSRQVRQEYSHLGNPDFFAGRLSFLHSFLLKLSQSDPTTVFRTEYFRLKFIVNAKRNMEWEIDKLSGK